jgi:hypothetical protein
MKDINIYLSGKDEIRTLIVNKDSINKRRLNKIRSYQRHKEVSVAIGHRRLL